MCCGYARPDHHLPPQVAEGAIAGPWRLPEAWVTDEPSNTPVSPVSDAHPERRSAMRALPVGQSGAGVFPRAAPGRSRLPLAGREWQPDTEGSWKM